MFNLMKKIRYILILFFIYYSFINKYLYACDCEKHIENIKQGLNMDSSLAIKKDPQVIYFEEFKNKKFVGAEKCKLCHSVEYRKWLSTKHARAYEDMEKHYDEQKKVNEHIGKRVNGETNGFDSSTHQPIHSSAFLKDCQPCHTTGYGYKFGFKDKQISNNLINVQCEICHGPGENHISNPGQIKMTYGSNPIKESLCRSCHSEIVSRKFKFEEYKDRIDCGK